ncbi:AcrR family transcriptional regulator [Crossiella equi]|uniref:AcrR family transcriptional regulator n=1 Tax=Crossiella equi TaxID=130796 RepID=A0ABS5A7R0_9PSEU|nr:TetR/AcrR family transcriptional regulator [Crossiella equi]MBP2472277.1 AcrR family transcriptional regulator [Crossiella equi]
MTSSATPLNRAERKKQELRREIIDAAFDCFAEQGYHATGIADIATRLGIGHGTFYRYFQNKRDIVDHVIDDLINRIKAALVDENAPDAVSTLAAYREQSARIGEALARICLEDPRVPRFLLFEAAGIDKAMADRVLDFVELASALTAAYLRHGVDQGYLRADLDVDNSGRAITGMIFASALSTIRNPSPAHQRELSEAVRRVMYDGIAAR